jgi:hypothetical protein
MNNAEQRLITGRTAALTVALRRGDAFGAARAAARLRLPGVPLTRQQLALARRAREAVGRSLIHAKYFPTTHRDVIVPPAPRQLRRRVLNWRLLLAIPIVALLVVLIVLMSRPAGPDAGGGAAAPDRPVTVIDPAKNNLRGRTSAAPTVAVVVTPPPTATPTTAPTTAPSPVGTPAQTAGPGSSGGGSGGGLGGGGIGPGPTAPPGFRIFTLDVMDEETGAPLANVCVNIGQPTCDEQHRTNAFGRWTWPISKSETTKWDMQLSLATYNPWKESFLVLPGDEPHKVVKMTRAFGGA